ncbi:heparanase isoform X1 [Octopus bimaculoides]|uniref:Heparanase n=1 Tax=Octopus bimaculoides TaxID=37653 RepID=A0A0L8GAZ4_OCTBM|nr:heparanase isoform X1 [Octopus bimaculoides]XP_052828847.1 heparanase isoform X1 [Octopus bimaculoides]|eukprot:XP_014782571.1 PREDICTED: heparanase-like [Octopus bimaculoides]
MSHFYVLLLFPLYLQVFGYHEISDSNSTQSLTIAVLVYPDIVLQNISSRFLSVTIDTDTLKNNWQYLNTSSTKVQTLACGLSPVYLRIGGTLEDFLYFHDDSSALENVNNHLKPFNITGHQIDELFKFTNSVHWDVVFGLNMLNRQHGKWNADNAVRLLQYIAKKGYPVAALELGNEPDVYQLILPHRPDPTVLASDVSYLRSIMDQIPHLKGTKLLGPDVTNQCVTQPSYKNFFKKYLDAAHTFLDAVTLHQYYLDGKYAKLWEFYDIAVMDRLENELASANDILRKHAPGKKLWLGETSAAWDSGSVNVSNSFVAGFLWLDKLGLAAKYGVEIVMRQDFYGGNYGLIQFKNLDPNPDYWLSLLFKTLVGGPVFETVALDPTKHFRVYTHCTNLQRTKYGPGAITVYFLNVFSNKTVAIDFPKYSNQIVHLYLLEPADEMGLKSRNVKLNGIPLHLLNNNQLPSLKPKPQKQPVLIPPLTFGFIVLPNAKARPCYI